MTARQYARLSAPFRQPARRKALLAANKAATWGCYLAYPLLLLVLALRRSVVQSLLITLCLSLVLAFVILHEQIDLKTVLGALLITAGTFVMIL